MTILLRMKSFQNLILLQNLYRLQLLGFKYVDHFSLNSLQNYEEARSIEELVANIQKCYLCDLSKSRTQSMSGFGNVNADLFVLDYAVSQTQDISNNYYAGRSGETLQKMVENVLGIPIDEIYITHAVKCKPLQSNTPSVSEFQSCKGYLFTQLHFVRPKVIVTLGAHAYSALTGDTQEFENVRGHVIDFQGAKLIPLYHPQFLLRNPEMKKIAMNDLKTIKSCL